MLKAKNKNVVDIIFNNKHAVKVYKGAELIWQKIADLLHLTQVCGESVQEPPNLAIAFVEGGISSAIAFCYIDNSITSPYILAANYYRGVATYFKAKPNTTYSVSGNVSGNRYVHIASYTSIDDLSNKNLGTSLGSNTTTFTTLDNTEYVVVAWTHNVVGTVITFSDIKTIESNVQPSPSNPIEIKSVGDKMPNGKYRLQVDVNGTISTCCMEQPLRKVGNEWDEIYRDETGYHIERRIYEDSDSAEKPMEQGLHLLDESIFEDVEWDVEPIIHQGDEITFLTEIQPSDYTIE